MRDSVADSNSLLDLEDAALASFGFSSPPRATLFGFSLQVGIIDGAILYEE